MATDTEKGIKNVKFIDYCFNPPRKNTVVFKIISWVGLLNNLVFDIKGEL